MSGFAQLIDNYFHITEKGSTIRTEIRGGIITFLAMVYILAVNPIILTTGGLYNVDWNAVFLATALAAIISCLLMGLYAKFPVALAPGMGINAFISYTIASQLGGSYPICLAAVFVSGIIFLVISVTNIREKIIMSIPTGMRYAIAAGIGFFIALVGLTNAGIIVHSSSALQFSNALFTPPVLLGLFCIFVTIILWLKKWWGAVIGGMFITLVVGLVIGMFYSDPSGLIPVLPDSVITDFGNINYIGTFLDGFATIDWGTQLPVFLATVLALFIVDMFDTAGTLLAVANRANLIDERGEVENLKRAMIVDSVGTVVGAAVGTTTTTSYIESSTGVEAGARTGFMAVIVGLLFLVALFLSPIFGMFTSACTCGALVLVGILMISSVKDINWTDPAMVVCAFMTIFIMGLSGSITNGIAFGIFGYILGMALTKRTSEVSKLLWILAIIFVIYYVVYYGFILM